MSSSLTGTGALVRLALRRDRVLLPVWAVVLVGSAASSASATADLYPTVASRLAAAQTINGTPALVALYGRIFDPTSLGSLALFKLSTLGPVLLAGLAIVLTVRHTRAEEEAGRLELVGAAVVGRRAPLAAAVTVALLSVVAIGLVTALSMVGAGLPANGSFALGLGWAGCGVVFCAVAAVAAQLATTGRTANGLAGMVLAAAYVLRAAGDASGPDGAAWLSWLSPVGWAQQMRAFAGERWWVLVLPAVAAAAGLGVAFVLAARRDLGAGLLPDRPGAAAAGALLSSPLALAFRLQRSALLAWTLSFVLLGGILGAITGSVSSLLASPQVQDLITKLGGSAGLTDAFLAAELGIAAIVATVFGVQAAGRLGTEEVAGHSEAALATAATRRSWALAYVTVSLLGTTRAHALRRDRSGVGQDHADSSLVGRGSRAGRRAGAAAGDLAGVRDRRRGVRGLRPVGRGRLGRAGRVPAARRDRAGGGAGPEGHRPVAVRARAAAAGRRRGPGVPGVAARDRGRARRRRARRLPSPGRRLTVNG